jgi:hypothetical protein
MKTTTSKIEKLNIIKDLVSQFHNNLIKWPHQLERKVAKILKLPKGYSQALYYERLNKLSSDVFQIESGSVKPLGK